MATRVDSAQRQIGAFARAKDRSGNLLHPHFRTLEQDMIQLARFDRLQGREPDLEDLYARACWATRRPARR
jgi:hypothetical protein